MAYKRKTEKSVQPDREIQEAIPKAQARALGGLTVRMCCVDEKNEWNFKAKNPFDAIIEGERICKENGFRFPQDVIVWDFS